MQTEVKRWQSKRRLGFLKNRALPSNSYAGCSRTRRQLLGEPTGGRQSSATVVLVSFVLRWFNEQEQDGNSDKRKLLGFTDNRQYAALRAVHFNDSVFVILFRASTLRGLKEAGRQGLDPARSGSASQKALIFFPADLKRRPDWMLNPNLNAFQTEDCQKALRDVFIHRLWIDQ